jgi:hypothetical protein
VSLSSKSKTSMSNAASAAQPVALPHSPSRPTLRPNRAIYAALSDDDPSAHTWVVAAVIPVSSDQARAADWRGSLTLAAGTWIDAEETYCSGCRQPYADVAHRDCDAKAPVSSGRRNHLMGGTPSERARRIVTAESDRTLIQTRLIRGRRRSEMAEKLRKQE